MVQRHLEGLVGMAGDCRILHQHQTSIGNWSLTLRIEPQTNPQLRCFTPAHGQKQILGRIPESTHRCTERSSGSNPSCKRAHEEAKRQTPTTRSKLRDCSEGMAGIHQPELQDAQGSNEEVHATSSRTISNHREDRGGFLQTPTSHHLEDPPRLQ